MPAAMGSNFWISNFPGGVGNPAAPAYGGGGDTDMLTARNPLDAKRQAAGFAPGASYPDGYLGNVGGRQYDKLAILQTRLTSTSYQRGVHAGSKQPQSAYYWSDDVNPSMGLARQAAATPLDSEGALVFQAQRFAPTGNPVELLVNDGKTATMSDRQREAALRELGGDPSKNPVTQVDPGRAARLGNMLPRWSGVRPGAL
jgi:hypothetical protein